jgi:hypothetical protein
MHGVIPLDMGALANSSPLPIVIRATALCR